MGLNVAQAIEVKVKLPVNQGDITKFQFLKINQWSVRGLIFHKP